jgi:hypothetical protein
MDVSKSDPPPPFNLYFYYYYYYYYYYRKEGEEVEELRQKASVTEYYDLADPGVQAIITA